MVVDRIIIIIIKLEFEEQKQNFHSVGTESRFKSHARPLLRELTLSKVGQPG